MRNKLLILAFLEGFFFLFFELSGVQLLQPYYGNSYYVWLTTLSIAMISSTFGYFFGGMIDRNPRIKKWWVWGACLLTSCWLIGFFKINEWLFLSVDGLGTVGAFLMHSLLLLGVPVFLVTSFSPLIIGQLALQLQKKGKAASTVFVVSTLGGVVCTYLMGFVILPEMNLIKSLYVFGFLFLISSGIVLYKMSNTLFMGINLALGLIFFLVIKRIQTPVLKGKNTEIVYRANGILGEIEVRDEFGKYRYLNINRMIQSGIQLENNNISAMGYPYKVSIYSSKYPAGSQALVAGLGGGVLINQFRSLDFEVDVVDMDKRLYEVSRKYMFMRSDFDFIVDDVRHFFNVSNKKYDIVVLDLSKGETIPSNVYTREGFKVMKNSLKQNGVVFINYFSKSEENGGVGLESIIKTLRVAGFFTAVIKKNVDDNSSEEMIVASMNSDILPSSAFRVPLRNFKDFNIKSTDYLRKYNISRQAQILSDDRNLLEKLQFKVILDYRQRARNNEVLTFYSNKKKQ